MEDITGNDKSLVDVSLSCTTIETAEGTNTTKNRKIINSDIMNRVLPEETRHPDFQELIVTSTVYRSTI